MLHVPVGANSYNVVQNSWGTSRPNATTGAAVTPGTGAYGSYASILTATNDSYGILICINANNGSAASRETVTKIGIDASGGTSYTDTITGLLSGGAVNYNSNGSGIWYYFPLFITAGSQIAAAGYGTVATGYRVAASLMEKPVNPSMIRKGSFVETLGQSGTAGTSVTSGTASEGSWTLIGSTTHRCWWWQAGVQVASSDTSWGANILYLDVAAGDATNKDVILADIPVITSTAETMSNPPITAGSEWDVPAGTNIYARLQNSGTNDTYTVVVYGCGG